MDNIAKRLKAYIEAHPFDPGDSCTKSIRNPMNPTRRIYGMASGNWMNYCDICHWKIIIPFSTSVAASVPPMNIKHSWMACNMGHS